MGTIKTLLTFEEFERLEDEQDWKTELLEGELIQLPPPIKVHSEAAEQLADFLKDALRRLRTAHPDVAVGKAHHEMGYLLGRKPGVWLVPDASVAWPNQPGEKYYEGSPMIAFEVASESNYPAYIARKVKKYLQCGTAEIWVFYTETRHALMYTASGERREDSAFHSEQLPGVEIPFAEFL